MALRPLGTLLWVLVTFSRFALLLSDSSSCLRWGEEGLCVCLGDSESGTCEEESGGTEDLTVSTCQHLSAVAPPSGGAGQVQATQ